MTVDEFIARLRKADCRIYLYPGHQVVVLTGNKEIADDLGHRGSRVTAYQRNPWGAKHLGEELIVEYDISLRAGMRGVTGADGAPVTFHELMEAAR